MQIGRNTTGMEAGLTVSTDKIGHEFCTVVVKGSFLIQADGTLKLAEKQEPMVYADKHYGEPDKTCIQYECDFAPFKPCSDIIVNGHALSPTGTEVQELSVWLEIGSRVKEIKVFGNRYWKPGLVGWHASEPEPFIKMPLTFDKAFGGSDYSHAKPKYQGAELRNPTGTGFHKNADPELLKEAPLPNLEDPRYLMRKWSDTPPPIGLGVIGRSWQPRIRYAGTYDDQWLNERFPFLPEDFDEHYFLSSPVDQQVPYLQGGERIRCSHMTVDKYLELTLPTLSFPIVYRFRHQEVAVKPYLDTVIIEPDLRRVLLIWRAKVATGPKLHALRAVLVGSEQKKRDLTKPHFKSMTELANWKKNS